MRISIRHHSWSELTLIFACWWLVSSCQHASPQNLVNESSKSKTHQNRGSKIEPKEKAQRELGRAYESLVFGGGLSRLEPSNEAGLKNMMPKARALYQQARALYDQGDYGASANYARASHEASKGMEQAAKASLRADSSLNEPPEIQLNDPPEQKKDQTLNGRKLAFPEAASDKESKDFLEASDRLLDQAMEAQKKGETWKAHHYWLGADAFVQAADRLYQAKNPGQVAVVSPKDDEEILRTSPTQSF